MIRTILVPVCAADMSRPALETALSIARQFDAHIEALHVRPDPRGLVPYTGEGMDGSMIEEIMEVTDREGGERLLRAKQMFGEFCSAHGLRTAASPQIGAGVTVDWRETLGREDEIVAIRGRVFDLIVVGRPIRDSALPSPITLEAAMLDTGRPIVVAPPKAPADVGTAIAIAWEGSREMARAVADALPLLGKASRVTILAARALADEQPSPEEYVTRLAWGGISSEILRFDASITELGPAFLAEARKVRADLLVKGAFSQSRLRQLIFGGRTKHILAHAEIPVLFAHC